MAFYIGHNWTKTFVGESNNAPPPSSILRIVTGSINFGNPEHIRKLKAALLEAQAKSEDIIGKAPEERQTAPLCNGISQPSSVPKLGFTWFSDDEESCKVPIHVAVRKRLAPAPRPQPVPQPPPLPAPRIPSKQKPKGRASGYVLFLRHVNREMGGHSRMGITELIRHYDDVWKALSDVERDEWKNKGKQIRNSGDGQCDTE